MRVEFERIYEPPEPTISPIPNTNPMRDVQRTSSASNLGNIELFRQLEKNVIKSQADL